MLLREEPELFGQFDRSSLRHIFSVGEPLNPEVIHWGRRVLGHDIYDTWFQTETGAIMVANRPGLEVRPGSMGQPVPGIEAAVLDEETLEPQPPGQRGHLCLRAGWPSMFQTYLNRPDSYQSKFRNGYYFTGDTACRDSEGFFWFTGRSDDVINTAGHLISPFEIESALIEMDSVVESGVIGAPDELIFEKVVAFIVLKPDAVPSPELELKIRIHVSNRVSSIATPQEMVFVPALPKNKSGKILRRMLRAQYLGEDVGDISTLEEA
jgi:acetyl-CoA synthetase